MKCWIWFLTACIVSVDMWAQPLPQRHEIEAHLRFLADDALEGRKVGTRGHDIAAQYIETQLRLAGVQLVPGKVTFRQPVAFDRQSPAKSGNLTWGKINWTHGEEMIWRAGKETELEAAPVFVGYGEIDSSAGVDDLANKSIEGKIVIAYLGTRNSRELTEIAQASREKRARFQAAGAVALLEIYKLNIPWPYIKTFLMREQVRVQEDGATSSGATPLLYGWIQEEPESGWATLLEKESGQMRLQSSGNPNGAFTSDNIIGWIPGSDAEMADEYLIISAHFDHVGIGNPAPADPTDSIYNGARDNAIGTTALLAAARYFAENPPKRSVLLMALTAEESGLLGSQYYVEHPWLPLSKAVLDFNSDGGGYNDTSAVAVMGYDRCGV
ncbi:MAG: M28 family peptidase, partial [Bacteroidota bacterium]